MQWCVSPRDRPGRHWQLAAVFGQCNVWVSSYVDPLGRVACEVSHSCNTYVCHAVGISHAPRCSGVANRARNLRYPGLNPPTRTDVSKRGILTRAYTVIQNQSFISGCRIISNSHPPLHSFSAHSTNSPSALQSNNGRTSPPCPQSAMQITTRDQQPERKDDRQTDRQTVPLT
jgi:hypothetical protein